jgi:hypothetical protein
MMSTLQHQDMRTTLTLDDDLAAQLKAESRRAGRLSAMMSSLKLCGAD